MAERDDVIAALKNIREEIVTVAEGAPEGAWSAQTYEDGWTARDVLSHMASTTSVASVVLSMARAGGNAGMEGFDIDAHNRQQVEMRADKSVSEVLDEIRANIQRDVQAVEGAPDDLLSQHFATPWGVEGSVAHVILEALNGHLGGHIADLRGALPS